METPTIDATKSVIIAGLAGSLLSLSFVDNMNLKQRFVSVLAGMAMAHYLSPFVSHVFSEDKFEETIGFLIGLFGMSITAAIFRAIQHSDVWSLIMRRWGNSTTPGGE